MMNMRIVLSLLFVFAVSGCKAPPKPQITDDTIETSQVNGVTLTHRHIVQPPKEFQPIGEDYRALYGASVMSIPDYSGKVIRQLETGQTYVVLGQVEHFWMALATEDNKDELVGYVPLRAVVKSDLYDQTIRADRPRPRAKKKADCVSVDHSSKACKNANSGTWIIN